LSQNSAPVVCSVLFSVCGGWKSKQTWGYFPSATCGRKSMLRYFPFVADVKEEHVDAIFCSCWRKSMCSKHYFLSAI